jgi:hypothetical protein
VRTFRLDSILVISSAVLTLCLRAADAGPSYATAQSVAKSVVAITATHCADGSSRAGTGFVYQSTNQVVTAHHVVAGCGDFSLWFERVPGQPTVAAHIARVLMKNDLALLAIQGTVGTPTLQLAQTVDFNDSLKAIGYAVNQPTLSDQDISFSIGNDHLRQMLPPENLRELSGSPLDLDATIYRFKSSLYPGMSGGPIFDTLGKVVAIVAGGLKSGAVAASWGWPAARLADLMSSNDPLDSGVNLTQVYYTYARRGDAFESRRCGNIDFVRIARRSFGAMSRTADNPDRLLHTVAISTRPISEVNAMEFDIWTNVESGATVAVPAGINLQIQNGLCFAASTTGPFVQLIWGTPAGDDMAIAAANEFEQRFMGPMAVPNFGYSVDNGLTLPEGQLRNDGFLVNRKAFVIRKSPPAMTSNGMHQFETIMHRGTTFVGVATVNGNFPICAGPCPLDPAYLIEWTRFILGTQLATYPVY